MTDIRVLSDEAQYRAHHTVFRRAMHWAAAPDEMWEVARQSYEPGRVLGAHDDDVIIGSTQAFTSRLVVPGGEIVPHAAISRVGVRADYRRRGVLSALMREQLSTLPEPVATLRATEGRIYGRFGYGVAGRVRTVKVDKHRAVIPGQPVGRVRMLDLDTRDKLLPELHDAFGLHRPGTIGRWPAWWTMNLNRKDGADNLVTVVHSGPDGADGFLSYKVSELKDDDSKRRLSIDDFVASTPDAWRDLWLYVVNVDLVDTIDAWCVPLDDPLESLFEDRRVQTTTDLWDELWLRLVDVPWMLAARTYGDAAPVVLEVRDELLPANSGRYRVAPTGVTRVESTPDITLSVEHLGAVYFGDTTFTQLAAAKRIEGTRLADADALFAVTRKPFCGTFF